MQPRFRSLAVILAGLAASLIFNQPVAAFDLDTGNAPIEVIIRAVAPIIFSADVSPSGSDATLVLRVTTEVTNAWFDATAPYHVTAQGVNSRLYHRPPADSATNRNINIACLYATYQRHEQPVAAADAGVACDARVGRAGSGRHERGHDDADRYRQRCRQSGRCRTRARWDEPARGRRRRSLQSAAVCGLHRLRPANTAEVLFNDPSRWQRGSSPTAAASFASRSS